MLFNSPRAYTDIHGTRVNIIRGNFYKAWKRDGTDLHTVNAIEPELHAKRRKLLNLAFTEQSLKAMSPIITKHIDRWTFLLSRGADPEPKQLKEKGGASEACSRPVDIAVSVEHLAFDILGELCFGETFNTKEPGANLLKKVPDQIMNQVAFGYKVCQAFASMRHALNIITAVQVASLRVVSLPTTAWSEQSPCTSQKTGDQTVQRVRGEQRREAHGRTPGRPKRISKRHIPLPAQCNGSRHRPSYIQPAKPHPLRDATSCVDGH